MFQLGTDILCEDNMFELIPFRYVSKSETIKCSEGIAGSMSEWYGNRWRVIHESNNLEILEDKRFREVTKQFILKNPRGIINPVSVIFSRNGDSAK